MSKPFSAAVSAPVPACPQLSPTGQERTGEDRRGQDTYVDPSTTSPHCPTGGVSSTPLHSRAREFEHWLVYEDEKEAIREEAVLLQKRLHQLRRRWQSIVAAQAEERETA